MGAKQIKVEPFKIDANLLSQNINQRGLKDTKNFSIIKMKDKAISLFEEAKKLTEDNDKYLKLKEAISYDNTNTEIMEIILNWLKNAIILILNCTLNFILIIFLLKYTKQLPNMKKKNHIWNYLMNYSL